MLPTTTAKGLERQDRNKDNAKFIDSSRPEVENGVGDTSDIAPGSSDNGHHELFDLDLRHVLSVSGNRTGKEYYRGPNPHSHTGDSENYFIVMEDPKGDTVAVDWKRGDPQVYYAFQWLLVKNGYHDVRNVRDSGTGYTAEEQYYAWIEAKRRGLISNECTMPRRAFNHHVVTEGYIEQSDLIESDDYRGKELPQGMFKQLAPRVAEDFEFVTGYEPRFRDQNQEPETEGEQETGSSLLPPETFQHETLLDAGSDPDDRYRIFAEEYLVQSEDLVGDDEPAVPSKLLIELFNYWERLNNTDETHYRAYLQERALKGHLDGEIGTAKGGKRGGRYTVKTNLGLSEKGRRLAQLCCSHKQL